jgi:5,5'-dehydrodivanillate O-demethylase oxygenase subunit
MISERENDVLARVGAGTPMGDLQRRYWHVVGAVEELATRYTKRVRLLGEDLVLYRDRSGALGLIGEFCPHRRASLAYGIPAEDGIRCAYHGWKFDGSGACIEQPNEPAGSTFAGKVATAGYPVETLGGLIWAYLGPLPAPLLPRWDGLTNANVIRTCGWTIVDCNWLQIMENSLDPIHTEWLHGALPGFLNENRPGSARAFERKHLKIAFDEFPYGIYKRRLLAGQTEDADDWKVGHPVLFPNILAVGSGGGDLWKVHSFQIRVPIDDEHTMHYCYDAYEAPAGIDVPAQLLGATRFYEIPKRNADGEYALDMTIVQDMMAWETQGPIAKRHLERLGTTDRGVILFRDMLKREIARMQAGEDPLGTIRDPAHNDVVEFHIERNKAHFTDGFEVVMRRSHVRYSPIAQQICTMFARYNSREPALA